MNSVFWLILACIAVGMAWLFWPALKHPQSRGRVLPVCILALLFAGVLYLLTGAPFMAEKISTYQQETAKLETSAATLEAKAEKTAADWQKMGQIYQKMQAYEKAVQAFRAAVVASNGAPAMILDYGKAQMMAAGGAVTDDAKEAFTMAAALMPANPEPLFFLAMRKAQDGKTEEAREALQTLALAYPEAAGLQAAIAEELARMP